jgi:hypothetical protein
LAAIKFRGDDIIRHLLREFRPSLDWGLSRMQLCGQLTSRPAKCGSRSPSCAEIGPCRPLTSNCSTAHSCSGEFSRVTQHCSEFVVPSSYSQRPRDRIERLDNPFHTRTHDHCHARHVTHKSAPPLARPLTASHRSSVVVVLFRYRVLLHMRKVL